MRTRQHDKQEQTIEKELGGGSDNPKGAKPTKKNKDHIYMAIAVAVVIIGILLIIIL